MLSLVRNIQKKNMMLSPVRNIQRRHILSPEKNRARATPSHRSDNVFVESVPLRKDQLCSMLTRQLSHFEYPTIPLPYCMHRKKLSDNLFDLSKEWPVLKEECAIMLRQARKMWDVAVAELLTQLIVAIHRPQERSKNILGKQLQVIYTTAIGHFTALT